MRYRRSASTTKIQQLATMGHQNRFVMLQSILIKNFRSCEQVSLRMGEPVIALVGKNGVGKTNLLHGIQLATDLCVGEPESMFSLHPRDRSSPTEFELSFTIRNSQYAYAVVRTSPPFESGMVKESLVRDGTSLFERSGEVLESSGTGLPPGFGLGLHAASLPSLIQILPKDGVGTSICGRCRTIFAPFVTIRFCKHFKNTRLTDRPS